VAASPLVALPPLAEPVEPELVADVFPLVPPSPPEDVADDGAVTAPPAPPVATLDEVAPPPSPLLLFDAPPTGALEEAPPDVLDPPAPVDVEQSPPRFPEPLQLPLASPPAPPDDEPDVADDVGLFPPAACSASASPPLALLREDAFPPSDSAFDPARAALSPPRALPESPSFSFSMLPDLPPSADALELEQAAPHEAAPPLPPLPPLALPPLADEEDVELPPVLPAEFVSPLALELDDPPFALAVWLDAPPVDGPAEPPTAPELAAPPAEIPPSADPPLPPRALASALAELAATPLCLTAATCTFTWAAMFAWRAPGSGTSARALAGKASATAPVPAIRNFRSNVFTPFGLSLERRHATPGRLRGLARTEGASRGAFWRSGQPPAAYPPAIPHVGSAPAPTTARTG
jgi:hypothetical protein